MLCPWSRNFNPNQLHNKSPAEFCAKIISTQCHIYSVSECLVTAHITTISFNCVPDPTQLLDSSTPHPNKCVYHRSPKNCITNATARPSFINTTILRIRFTHSSAFSVDIELCACNNITPAPLIWHGSKQRNALVLMDFENFSRSVIGISSTWLHRARATAGNLIGNTVFSFVFGVGVCACVWCSGVCEIHKDTHKCAGKSSDYRNKIEYFMVCF